MVPAAANKKQEESKMPERNAENNTGGIPAIPTKEAVFEFMQK